MKTETNPYWRPIERRQNAPLWTSAREVIETYQQAGRSVSPVRSARYSLILTEPCPPPRWSEP